MGQHALAQPRGRLGTDPPLRVHARSVADALRAVAEHRDVPLTSLAEEFGVERRSVMTNRPRTLSVTFQPAFPGLVFVP
jgi:hypothetical protein